MRVKFLTGNSELKSYYVQETALKGRLGAAIFVSFFFFFAVFIYLFFFED